MRTHLNQLFVAGLVVALLAVPGLASTTSLYTWNMGEDDPGATVGGTASTTYNTAGTGFGSAYNDAGKVWSSDVPSLSKTGTTLSIDYAASTAGAGSPDDGFTVGNVTTALPTDNFGFELWVRKDNTTPNGDRTIFALGYNNGVELRHNSSSYYMNLPAVGAFGLGAFTNDWMHIAYVRDDGTMRLFLDGDEVYTDVRPIYAPGTLVSIGGNYYQAATAGTPYGFDGKVDDIRVFTFEAGQFVAPTLDGSGNVINGGDLNIVPEPATLGLLGLGGLALLRRRRR